MKKFILYLLSFYHRYLSIPNSCRFYPTCSVYAYQAIEKYGILHGSILGLKRIIKCNRFHPGGADPVN